MFGIGGKKEDKLEENMEEIKNLINRGKSTEEQQGQPGQEEPDSALKEELQSFDSEFSGQESQAGDQSFDQESDFDQSFDQEESFENDNFENDTETESSDSRVQKFDDSPEEPETRDFPAQEPVEEQDQSPQQAAPQQNQQPAGQQNLPENNDSGNSQPRSGGRMDGSRESQQSRPRQQQQDGQEPQNTRSRQQQDKTSSKPDIPQPAKTRELDVPEIEKGPLFIKRQKFENAQSMIQDMRYLSQEIEQVVRRLEDGIEEDQQTERQAKELLHTLEENRHGVTDIINPEDNQ